MQKLPQIAPQGFEPLYSGEDWQAYQEKFGKDADDVTKRKSSGQAEFAARLIAAAESEEIAGKAPGLQRLLLVRAAAISYRTAGGYPTANKAMTAFQRVMDKQVPSHSAALWTVANQMARMSVTPKPERIRYSAIAARANMNLALLLLDMSQVEAASGLVKQLGFHEGWLKSDPATRTMIAQVRGVTTRTATMLDYLGQQYPLALKGDDAACMSIYVWARFVKNNMPLAADVAARKPNSSISALHNALESAAHDPMTTYAAAETLKAVAGNLPDGILKQRTLYAALQNYRAFIKAPETEAERVKRTLALMAIDAVVGDGAKGPSAIRPLDMAVETQPATQPTTRPAGGASPTTQPTTEEDERARAVG